MKPLALSDSQMSAVMSAAAPLPPSDRAQFLRALAEALRSEPGELGDGVLARTIRHVIRPFFKPPLVKNDPPSYTRRNVGEPIA